jgi:hypothetical protein
MPWRICVLRRGWLNFDLLWSVVLELSGLFMLLA